MFQTHEFNIVYLHQLNCTTHQLYTLCFQSKTLQQLCKYAHHHVRIFAIPLQCKVHHVPYKVCSRSVYTSHILYYTPVMYTLYSQSNTLQQLCKYAHHHVWIFVLNAISSPVQSASRALQSLLKILKSTKSKIKARHCCCCSASLQIMPLDHCCS